MRMAMLMSFTSVIRMGSTLGSRGYFFLIDTDRSRRSHVNEAQSAEKKKINEA